MIITRWLPGISGISGPIFVTNPRGSVDSIAPRILYFIFFKLSSLRLCVFHDSWCIHVHMRIKATDI